jgi:hypothetical protein
VKTLDFFLSVKTVERVVATTDSLAKSPFEYHIPSRRLSIL